MRSDPSFQLWHCDLNARVGSAMLRSSEIHFAVLGAEMHCEWSTAV